ncbi:hypothetical protein BC826DRAFT_1079465 [Russula brevipes]|nr:hypothetical protein BC826DRAFT_1087177 [Russula brevipes]KAI0279688.1 hypothetical protein BC826DRAFT_1079465 [Russula brevipes]
MHYCLRQHAPLRAAPHPELSDPPQLVPARRTPLAGPEGRWPSPRQYRRGPPDELAPNR